MTDTRKFDDLTSWHQLQPVGFGMGWDPGWRANGGAFSDNISRSDPYWGQVLDKAKVAYGDPNMRFNTADPNQDRYLVFGDGTRVPADGSLAYRDSANSTTYLLNDDGSVSSLGANGQAGQPILPSGFRESDGGRYAPVDAAGNQVAPLVGKPPQSPFGYHDHDGVLTPKNARGDYYVDDAAGTRTYFDATDKPITAQQFADATTAPPTALPGLPTDEQQSGRTADAVRKLHEELKDRYSTLSEAESRLTEVLLNARATTADGQRQLNDIQQKIVEAVNNPALSLDTPAGEQAFLKFLRSQVVAIGEVLASGTLTAEDQSKTVAALTALYSLDGADTEPGIPAPAAGHPAAPAAAAPDPGRLDAGLGPMEPMPDPMLSDLGLGPSGGVGGSLGADPLSSLASALPAAMGAFGPGAGIGASPLGALSGLAGAAGPLAGLASQLGDQGRRADPVGGAEDDRGEDTDDEAEPKDEEPEDKPDQQLPPPAPPAEPQPTGNPGDGAPEGAPAPPVPPPTAVQLPDGSTANARTPELASAVKAHLAGLPVADAYRQAHIELPPPGTPVTNPVDPSRLSAGYLGMFSDHYVVALSSVKALQDGEVVSLSSVASSPNFLGWMDPSALGSTAPAPNPAPLIPPPVLPAPVPIPSG